MQYAYKNLGTRANLAGVENHFDGLTRSQFRQILCEGNPYKELIVDCLKIGWKQADWALFGELFAETNIETAHLQKGSFDVTKRDRYLRFCAMAEELTASMNELVARLTEQYSYLCVVPTGTTVEHDYLIKFCFKSGLRMKEFENGRICSVWPKGLGNGSHLYEHTISAEALTRVRTRLLDKMEHSPGGIVILDLLNINYMAEHFRAAVIEVVTALVYLAHVDRSVEVIAWMGSSVALTRNSQTGNLTT